MNERIKKLRKALDLTQQEFATKIGSTQNVLANYESGRRNPSSSVINNICKTFNANETWLRSGKGEMFVPRPTDALETFIRERNLSTSDRILIEKFAALDADRRHAVVEYVLSVADEIMKEDTAPVVISKTETTTPAQDTPGQERTVADTNGQEQMDAEKKSRIAAERKAGQEEMDAAEELTPEEQENLDSYRREMIAKRGQTGQQSALPNANVS